MNFEDLCPTLSHTPARQVLCQAGLGFCHPDASGADAGVSRGAPQPRTRSGINKRGPRACLLGG